MHPLAGGDGAQEGEGEGPIDSAAAANDVGAINEVVRRARQGDVQAFESIYRTHAQAVFAMCRRMTGDEREARELVQDVFVRVWERLRTFRGESALASWIHRLAVNVVLNRMRATRREAMRLLDDPRDEDFGTRSSVVQLDAGMDIDAATARLPAGARAVFVLHDVEGYSHEEIAHMTGIAPGTARTQLFRARRALTRMLDS